MSKKAEQIIQNQLNPTKDVDDVNHNLRVHQIELELQNEELRDAQIKLEDSRSKYFDLYNLAPVGYYTLDKNGIILDVNFTGATLLGVERVNLNKRSFIQHIDPEHRNRFHHHIKNVMKTGTKQTVNLKLKIRDNNPLYAHLETISVPDENGNINEFRINATDITDLKNTEEALKESQERYKEIFYNNHAAMLLIEPDTGDIIDANPAATNFYGYKLDELVKMKISNINISHENLVNDEMQKESPKKKIILYLNIVYQMKKYGMWMFTVV
jgi:chemotaxis family two-component system sensor kinase Cph1